MSPLSHPQSVVVNLLAGTHWICDCGQSKNYPSFDGEHQGTAFSPIEFVLKSAKTVEITL